MTYVLLVVVFVGIALAAAAVIVAASRRRPNLLAVALTVVVLFVLTVVFDTIMIAAGLFTYAPEQLAGVYLGLAPIEDLGYPLAVAVLLPALWVALRARRGGRDD